MTSFETEVTQRLRQTANNKSQLEAAKNFMDCTLDAQYSYNFFWLGRPIIQYPQDIVAFQELVWRVQPDIIIETGIAHGGSLILSASLLAMLDMCDASVAGKMLDPNVPTRRVVGVDIDIRSHNREAIEAHPLSNRIKMIQGSSVDPSVVNEVRTAIGNAKKVMVCLDSNHTHEHVLSELQTYAPLVTKDSYCIVFDTVVENMAVDSILDRPWKPGNSPMTAVDTYLAETNNFEIDSEIDAKLLISVAPRGYLKRVK